MKNYLLKSTLLLTAFFFVFYACHTDKEIEKTYVITYQINEGTGVAPSPQSYQTNGSPVKLNHGLGLSRLGYTFGGWSEKVGGAAVLSPYTPTGNVTLYAIWNPIIYAIACNLNGGMGAAPALQYYTYGGKAVTLDNGAGLSKEGFAFGGWSIADDDNTPVANPYTVAQDITLYAIWNAVAPYAIAYDLNGGTGATPALQYYMYSGKAVALNTGTGLSKEGFAFGGWAASADGNTPVANPYTPTADVTLYVVWKPIYAVTYDLNGGTGTTPTQQTYTQGGTGIALSAGVGLSKTGGTFGGWSIAAHDNTPVNNYYIPTGSLTLYAIWNPLTYTVTYDLNGGTGTTPTRQYYIYGGTGIALNPGAGFVKTGYAFGGWAIAEAINTPVANPYSGAAQDITLYAIWHAVAPYTVTYDLNGGTGATPAPQDYMYNGAAIALNPGAGFAKTGFIFGGWSIAAHGNTRVASPYTPAESLTLYAIWIPVYTVTYDLNGGTGTTPAQQTYTQGGTGIALSAGDGLSKTGGTFGGWAIAAHDNTPVNNYYIPTESLTLYAIWYPVTYTVAYDLSGGAGTTPARQYYTNNGAAVTLSDGADLTKTGFVFGGWAASDGGNTRLVSPYTPTTNVTLYAIWIPVYTVSYHLNGGTGTTPTPQTYTQGNAAIALNSGAGLSKQGSAFGGWAILTNVSTLVASPYTPTANVTLYAVWNAAATSYTVTYNTNGATSGTTPPPQTYNGTALTLNNGAGLGKTGSAFGGWAALSNSHVPLTSPYTPTANVTLYAVWNAVATSYTVTYNTNGATSGITPPPQTYNGTALTLNNGAGLSKTGSAFGGWAALSNSHVPLTSPYTPTANVTLYAIWNAVATSYTVTYNTNGATSGTTPPPQTYNGTALTLNNGAGLSKTGSAFGGWAALVNSHVPLTSPYTPTANVTLYAIWTQNPAANFTLNSTTYTNGGVIPPRCGREGANTSPQLSWTGAPTTNVAMYILVFFDATEGMAMWHFRRAIAANISSLAEGGMGNANAADSDWMYDYGGPAPPPWPPAHTYEFKLYAVRAGYTLDNFGKNEQTSWAALENENAAYIVGQSNIYSGTFSP